MGKSLTSAQFTVLVFGMLLGSGAFTSTLNHHDIAVFDATYDPSLCSQQLQCSTNLIYVESWSYLFRKSLSPKTYRMPQLEAGISHD